MEYLTCFLTLLVFPHNILHDNTKPNGFVSNVVFLFEVHFEYSHKHEINMQTNENPDQTRRINIYIYIFIS